MVLIGISGVILYEAYERLRTPPAVASRPMLAIAALGLPLTPSVFWCCVVARAESLNMKGAYYELLSDALTSGWRAHRRGHHVGDGMVLR